MIAVAKHAGQQTAARRFGADDVCAPGPRCTSRARASPARAGWSAIGGRELLLGGFDRVLDCVGSGASLEQAITVDAAARPRDPRRHARRS